METIRKEVYQVLKTLNEQGYEAWLVGGAVRNHLLGLPISDYDITTNARPQVVQACFKEYPQLTIGFKHGTVTVIINGLPIEITTYRQEKTYRDHRHPESIAFVSELIEDLKRRDFTINALCLNASDQLYDPLNGQKDLCERCIRAIGDPNQRFKEDALRILRSLRFAAQLAFKIEEKTEAAIFKNFPLLNNISLERKRDEFLKIIQAPKGAEILQKYYPVFNFVRLRQAFDYPFADYQEILAYILTDADFELRLSKKDNALIRELIACRTIDISDDKALINALSSPEQKRILDFLGAINQQDLTERVEMLRPYIVTPTSLAISNQELLAHGYQGSAISKKKQEFIAMIRQQKLRNDNSELRKVL